MNTIKMNNNNGRIITQRQQKQEEQWLKRRKCGGSGGGGGGGGGTRSICPPLVVAPNFGTLELIPASSLLLNTTTTTLLTTPTTSTQDSGMASINSSIHSANSGRNKLLSMRRPIQITADPRVYRGSVYANRRLAVNNARQVEKEENREKRYRVGVIRDQLSSVLPRVPQPFIKTSNKTTSIIAKSRNNFLPELSGSIDKKHNFTTARFTPIRNSAVEHNNNNNKTKRKHSLSTENENKYPVKVMVNYEKTKMNMSMIGGAKVHKLVTSQTATPPTSSRSVYPIVDSYVQTDDNFDEKFDDLVKELANSAISMALFQIEGEDELERMRKNAEKTENQLMEITQQQNEQKEKWKAEILKKNSELETWKQNENEAREAQKIALATCQEVTRKTLENIKMMEKNSKRSIGLDTREMNRFEEKMDLVTAEIEKDFLPWIFQRAERMFKNQIARNQLDHSMLNEVEHRREKAKKRLIDMNSHFLL